MRLILRFCQFLVLLGGAVNVLGAQNLPAQPFTFHWKPVEGAGGYLAEVRDPAGTFIVTRQVEAEQNAMTLSLVPGSYTLRLTTLNRFLTAESSTDWVPIHVAAPAAPEVGDFPSLTLRPGQPGSLKIPAKGLAVDATASLQSPSGAMIPLTSSGPDKGVLTLSLPPLSLRGSYILVLTNPPKLSTTVTGKLSVHYAPPVVSTLSPASLIIKDAGQPVDIRGSGFSPETVVTLKAGPQGASLTLVLAAADPSSLTAVIPPGLPPGDYLLAVANARDEEAIPAGTLTLAAPPPPVVEVLPPPEPEPTGPSGDPKVTVSTFAASEGGDFLSPWGIAHRSSGSIFVSDTNGNVIRALYPDGEITKFAGSGKPGSSNGKGGDSATFKQPTGVAIDSHGNLLVADSGNSLLRKITPEGEVSTVTDLPNPSRTFAPQGLAIDSADNLYLADSANNVILLITAAGKVSVLAGTGKPGAQNGAAGKATFAGPQGIAVNASGTVFVADTENNLIRRITPDGLVSILAGSGEPGTNDGKGVNAQFNQPTGILVGAAGALFVTEGNGQRVRRVAADGTVTTVAGSGRTGAVDGPGDRASFRALKALALADDGALLLVDAKNRSIRRAALPAEDLAESQFAVSTWAGNGVATFKNAYGPLAGFNSPGALALDGAGNLYVADTGNHSIRKVAADGAVTTVSGTGKPGSSNGSIFFWDQPSYDRPTGVAVAADGTIYVADSGNNLIRKISPKGEVSVFAGNGKYWTLDGQGDRASFSGPTTLAMDPYGTLYVVEDGGGYGRIRKIEPNGRVTSVVTTWSADAAKLVNPKTDFSPGGLAADGIGNLYVSTKVSPRILKVTPDGQIHILAGSGSPGALDGKGLQASFQAAGALSLDHYGNLYVADTLNHSVRRVTLDGTVTSISAPPSDPWRFPAGIAAMDDGSLLVADTGNHRIAKVDLVPPSPNLNLALSQVAGQGTLSFPGAAAADTTGNLYIIDGNSIVRMTPAGAVSTVAGSGQEGNSDGAGASASFRRPQALALDDAGNLYVADTGNNALRFVSKDGVVTTLSKALHRPLGVAINRRGRVFVADTDSQAVLEFTGNDVIRGIRSKKAFVPLASALVSPRALAADAWGNILIVDGNRIKRIDPQGRVLALAGSGTAGTLDGWGKSASFSTPIALTLDKDGNAFVIDQGYGHVRRVNPSGVVDTIDTVFDLPVGIAVDPQGRIWVTDGLRQKVQVLVPQGSAPLASLVPASDSDAGPKLARRTISLTAGLAAWAGVRPALQMASPLIVWPAIPGSSPRAVYLAQDDRYFYWLMTLADGRPRGSNSINYALEIFQSPGGSQMTAKIDGWSHYIQPALIFGNQGDRQWRDIWRGSDADRTVGEGFIEARFPKEQLVKTFSPGSEYQVLVHVYRAAAEVPFREGPRLGWSSVKF